MARTADPRAKGTEDPRWDDYPYAGVLGEWVIKKPKAP